MTDYSHGFKLKAVKDYLEGNGSYNSLAKKYGTTHSSLSTWVNKYKIGGVDALKKATTDTPYSVQFKLDAIQLYQTTDISYQKLALQLGISSNSMLQRWVKQYDAKGIEGISQTRSAPNKMNKKENKRPNQNSLDGLTEEEIQKKLLHLEIENAYLKELWSLKNKEKRDLKTKKNQE